MPGASKSGEIATSQRVSLRIPARYNRVVSGGPPALEAMFPILRGWVRLAAISGAEIERRFSL